jgi:hypothetical protein
MRESRKTERQQVGNPKAIITDFEKELRRNRWIEKVETIACHANVALACQGISLAAVTRH